MPEFTKAAKVGAMTIALTAALYVAYRFISPDAGTAGGYRVWAYLPDVSGVAPRSRVMIAGVQVGVVDDISLQDGRARVDIKMKPTYKLYDDATISRRSSSLIGEYFIVLTPGTKGPGREPLADGGRIKKVISVATISDIVQHLDAVAGDIKKVTATLRDTIGSDTGQKQIAAILKNIAEVTEQLNEAVKENRQTIKATLDNVRDITSQGSPEIVALLKNIRQVTQDVRDMTATAAGPTDKPGEIRSTVQRINRASESLESLLQHADKVAARIDRGEGTVGRLTKDETLINEVESVVEGVGDLVGGIGRLQTVVGLRTDYNFLANTVKSYVELRLQPSEDKYYLIEIVNDPRGLTSIEQVDVDTTNPNFPPHYRETRAVTTDAFRFSFQFAKRLGPFTGRFGVRESVGAIGVDLHLLNDRFELSQDLFFGEELTPRWRVAMSYEFVRKLWLLGGVDNIINSDRRDYFIGLQLRFNDEDLKTILPFTPAM